jgi:hypothetical protein
VLNVASLASQDSAGRWMTCECGTHAGRQILSAWSHVLPLLACRWKNKKYVYIYIYIYIYIYMIFAIFGLLAADPVWHRF